MVDGGRLDPLRSGLAADPDPGIAAGEALARALGVRGDVKQMRAPEGAKVLASVKSAQLATRVNDMMRFSDNVPAETLRWSCHWRRAGRARWTPVLRRS